MAIMLIFRFQNFLFDRHKALLLRPRV